jgi:hypothetical protein
MKQIIKISEIKILMDRFHEINSLNLDDIIFHDENDKPINIDEKIINDWKLIGLNIVDFIDSDFYLTGFEGQIELEE